MTGSSRGIGRATAEAFAAERASVIITCEPQEKDDLEQVTQQQYATFPGLSLFLCRPRVALVVWEFVGACSLSLSDGTRVQADAQSVCRLAYRLTLVLVKS